LIIQGFIAFLDKSILAYLEPDFESQVSRLAREKASKIQLPEPLIQALFFHSLPQK